MLPLFTWARNLTIVISPSTDLFQEQIQVWFTLAKSACFTIELKWVSKQFNFREHMWPEWNGSMVQICSVCIGRCQRYWKVKG